MVFRLLHPSSKLLQMMASYPGRHFFQCRLTSWYPGFFCALVYWLGTARAKILELVVIDTKPEWIGKASHAYGHLQLQISCPEVVPCTLRSEGLLRVLSWVSFELPEPLEETLAALLTLAAEEHKSLHLHPMEGQDVRMSCLQMNRNSRSSWLACCLSQVGTEVTAVPHSSDSYGNSWQLQSSRFQEGHIVWHQDADSGITSVVD